MLPIEQMREFLIRSLTPRHRVLNVGQGLLAEDTNDSSLYNIVLLARRMPLQEHRELVARLSDQGKVATVLFQDNINFFRTQHDAVRFGELERHLLGEMDYLNYYQPGMPHQPEGIRLVALDRESKPFNQAFVSKGKLQLSPRVESASAYLLPEGKCFD